jgi:hypothetical protein
MPFWLRIRNIARLLFRKHPMEADLDEEMRILRSTSISSDERSSTIGSTLAR